MTLSPNEFVLGLSEDRRTAIQKLREEIKTNLPKGFEETMQYGMLSFVVPHKIYPAGYHCDSKQPLPFLSLASPKSHIAVYHMGLYASPDLFDWFLKAYKENTGKEPDMGKSCIRFKKPENIPFALMGKLASKMNPAEWVSLYENAFRRGGGA
jgi:hypothetical protein